MVTAGGAADETIVIEAQDRASRVIQRVGNSLRTSFGTQLRSAVLSMVSFTAILSAVGLSISGLITLFRNWTEEMRNTNRAAGRLEVQFQLAGMSADRAAKQVAELRDNLNGITVQALPGLEKALRDNFLSLTPEAQLQISELAERFAEIRDIPFDQVFEALLEGLAGNLQPMRDLGIEGENFVEMLQNMQKEIDIVTSNQTPWEKLTDTATGAFTGIGTSFIENINKIFGEDSNALERINAFGGLLTPVINGVFESAFGDLPTTIGENIGKAFQAVIDDPAGALASAFEMGTELAWKITLGILTFLIGADAVEALILGIKAQWIQAKEKLADFWDTQGRDVVTAYGEGFINALTIGHGPEVVEFFRTQFPKFFTETLPTWFDSGWNMAKELARGLIEGFRQFLQEAGNKAVEWINRIIDNLNKALALIPGASTIPRLGNISLGGGGLSDAAPPRPNLGGRGNNPDAIMGDIVIPVHIGDRKIDTVIVDSLNRNLRRREPGLNLG